MRKLRPGLLAAIVFVVACAGTAEPTAGTTAPEPGGELLVSAAASLTDVFAEIESAFESARPEVDVVLNLGGSSALREQILEGAPVDLFASADKSNMDQVVEGGEVAGEPVIFARNALQIAVPAGNAAGVTGLEDFADEELLIGLCAEEVPCGAFARTALGRAGVAPALDSNEPDVRALISKIQAGELDAGIVYVTDVLSTDGAVDGIDIPEDANVLAEYSIATMVDSANPEAGEAFVELLISDEGQAILDSYGFAPP